MPTNEVQCFFYTMASTASIDDDSMDAATSDDRDLVRKACTYITEGAYPAGATANEKCIIRKKAKWFAVRNGELFYIAWKI